MSAATTTVPIEHTHAVHPVQTTRSRTAAVDTSPPMTRPSRATEAPHAPCQQYTLLELVEAIGEVTEDEREIIATVQHLIASGQVRLCGNLRDEPVDHLIDEFARAEHL